MKLYVIGMARKSDSTLYLNSKTGGAANKIYDDYSEAVKEIERLASIRSEDYEYLVLQVVASATVATKPVVVKEY